MGLKCYFIVICIYNSLMANDNELLLDVFISHLYIFFVDTSVQCFALRVGYLIFTIGL